jgi:glycyl-tRNA synthetase beta chain
MADLLLELFSEEIPARMQTGAAKELERLVVGALSDRGLLFDAARAFAGPRRLTLAVAGLPARQPDTSEERKGPRVDAPQKAIDGFLRSAGVTLDRCTRQSDAKGEFYIAVIHRKGRAIEEMLAECLPAAIGALTWPKSMRWTAGATRWVRPLHGIVCTLDGEVVGFEFAGVKSGSTTFGHRFLSQGPVPVRRFEDYEKRLRDAHVILDAAERKNIILHKAKQKAFALGLEFVEDVGLLEEVAGLAEWPNVLIGRIEEQFMELPAEILQTSMRQHQKYFSLKQTGTGDIANRFIVVSNIVTADGGERIIAGNERVLRARLSDARFFWEQDRKRRLESRVQSLTNIVFHAKAGSMQDRAYRIALLSLLIADALGFDIRRACRAGWLAKADLVSGVVGEFPELQGAMGRLYALHDGEAPDVCDAIRDHYRPLGPTDNVPTSPVSIATALADKIDSLVALWRAGEKPTGSKDPFALRRAALGILRIILDNRLRLPLSVMMFASLQAERSDMQRSWMNRMRDSLFEEPLLQGLARDLAAASAAGRQSDGDRIVVDEVLAFLADRLEVALREEGIRHDLIAAVFGLGREDDFTRLVARVRALAAFLKSEDGANLLAGYRRAVNIVRIEEKKDGRSYVGEPDPKQLSAPEEKVLFMDLATAKELVAAELERERFAEAMTVMARLRGPVDAFFESVTVNVAEAPLRENRLKLLSRLRDTLHAVADFSKIEG